MPSPSEYDEYSGLSDDLDLGLQDNDDEEGGEEEELNESDNDVRKYRFNISIESLIIVFYF